MKLNFEEIRKNPIEWAIYQEFICYINADLLPRNWQEPKILEELAVYSLIRLKSKIDINILKDIIHEMLNDRTHYLNKIAQEASNIEWIEEDSEWEEYQKFLHKMLNNI